MSAHSGQSMQETFEHIYPSLLQCFAVILLGYCIGRLGYISPTSSKGIGVFVSLVSLPALVFKSMVELDYSKVNWRFLTSILIAKSTVFFAVVLFTVILVRPTNFGKAGIYGIFCSQSNDLALGYPLVKAIYQDLHPEYVNYLYLMLPISLVILNPIGFILMQIQKQKQSTTESNSKLKIAFTAFKEVVTDPIVFMTLIGLVGHFIFDGHLPQVLDQILNSLGQAFLATALFYLGVRMVGNMTTKLGRGLLVPLLLISAKSLFLPLIAREMIQVLHVGSSSNETNSWSMFGFLYGTFPAAPSSAIFAAKFGFEEELITSTMVMSTFLSAPLMFISAQMSLLHYSAKTAIDFIRVLKDAMVDVSGTSLPFGIWVFVVLFLGRRYRIYPHNYTMCLIVFQIIACVSTILSRVPCTSQYWLLFVTILFFYGLWGSRCWAAMIAFSLCVVRCKGAKAVDNLRVWIWLFGSGIAIIIGYQLFEIDFLYYVLHYKSVANKLELLRHSRFLPKDFLQKFCFSVIFPFIMLSLLILCAVIIVVSLVYLYRHDLYCKCSRKTRAQCGNVQQEPGEGRMRSYPEHNVVCRCYRCLEIDKLTSNQRDTSACCQPNESSKCEGCEIDQPAIGVVNIEDIDESTCLIKRKQYQSTDPTESPTIEAIFGGKSVEMDLKVDEYLTGEKHQLGRHVTMLVIMLFTIIGVFLALWCLLKEDDKSGIFIALQIADAFCVYGQAFVVFACFGFEKQLIIIPFLTRWRKFWYGTEVITLPKTADLDADVVTLCDQFKRYHKQNCQRSVVSDLRYRLRKYKSVFRGDRLVNWLLEVGLATDRQAAVHYGNCLILGRVIYHVTQAHFFYDSPYLYQFREKSSSLQDEV
ncbi:unnamed protein product, partial [Porites lobata]